MGQGALTAIIHEIGPAFAERSTEVDRSGAFVEENYRALKARKLFSAGVPSDLGGGGASHAELCEMIRALARYCPSTALSLSMHTHLVAAGVWRHQHGQPAAALLQRVADGERVLVSTGANDWLESSGVAERVEGGWRVTAKKRFASGSPAGDFAVTSAPAEVPDEGAIVLHFAVPLDAPGVTLGTDWDTMGMRATGSHTLSFEGVFVPDAAISARRPRGKWHPSFNVITVVAIPIFYAAYVGLAEQAAALARTSGARRATDPHLPYQIGAMENELFGAQLALEEMVRNARNYDFTPEIERANRSLMCKTLGAAHVRRCLDLAVESSGGSAYFKTNPIERLWRDAQAVQFHPMPERPQHLFTGRLALGLPA
jgi:alkylation response protein AidB-like acyl-CoA dehydrogenase